ncbi:MAG: hypothetical protein H6605_10580 [Flavobacteriales bacterium]|nr:hypothetical protein [Flavobacteriales bacterium]
MIRIKAFRAIDDEAMCLQYAHDHHMVLKNFNLTNLTTNNIEWAYDPNVYVVVAISEKNGHLLGGIRIQIASENVKLPVQNAVSHFDPKINELVDNYRINGGTAELCGLWNSREEAPHMGITLMLVLAGLAISNQLKITSLFTIVASYTLKIALQVGFRIEKSVGVNGEFVYPNSNYVARVLIMDPKRLNRTYKFYKRRIMDLRQNLNFEKIETTPKGEELPVKYDLKLNSIT